MKAFSARTIFSRLDAESLCQRLAGKGSCMCGMLLCKIGCTQWQSSACFLQLLRQMCSVEQQASHLLSASFRPPRAGLCLTHTVAGKELTNVSAGLMQLCRMRVVCFHNAGSAEDMFTSDGTGVRKAASPLLVRQKLPCLAVHRQLMSALIVQDCQQNM